MCVQSKSMQKYVENFGTATEILCQLQCCVFFLCTYFSSTEFSLFLFFHSLQRRRQTNREKNGFHNNPMILLFSHCTPILCINVPIPMQYMPIHIHTITEVSYILYGKEVRREKFLCGKSAQQKQKENYVSIF